MKTGIKVNGPDALAVEAAIGHIKDVLAAIAEHHIDRETGIEALKVVKGIVSTNISNCSINDCRPSRH